MTREIVLFGVEVGAFGFQHVQTPRQRLACDQRQMPHFKVGCDGEAIQPPFKVGWQSHIKPFGLCHGASIHTAYVAQIRERFD